MIAKVFTSAILFFALLSCDGTDRNTGSGDIPVTGKVGEILVVCDNGIWESEIQKCLDTNLTQFIMPYFPDVATFELEHRTPENFTGGFKRYRNTLFLTIDPKLKGKNAKIEKRKGVWATDQLVIEVIAGSFNELVTTCRKGLNKVHEEFESMETSRILKYNKMRSNGIIDKKLASNFGIGLELPNYSKLVTTRPNFYRIEFPAMSRPIEFVGKGSQDAGLIKYGVMIYQYPFQDSSQLSMESLLKARDTMLRYNVPSDFEGMYMGTQYVKLVYPEMNTMTTKLGGVEGFEIRGMFQFKGMGRHGTGGAFWSFHFVHPKRNKIVCVSGYVDAPSMTSWTHPLRDVEAVLQSVKLN